MTDIINFIQRKNEKEEQQIEQAFKRAHSLDDRVELLLQNKSLQVEDHKLFLAFLTYVQQQNLQAEQVFKDVINMPKYQFEQSYLMNWSQVVKLTATFLSILQQTATADYEAFRASL